ncbi:MOSC domain-containing protein [Salinicoccus siamensis]|uniref:MOSC domain-containing protein n=1 Tax=Salinicoccus siamensis TaxID=381830 RepID=A0ABV5Z538_9STAP
MGKPKVRKLFTGKVKTMGDPDAENKFDREWQSAIFKTERHEKVYLTETGFDTDSVADKRNHGGPEKAVFAYPVVHYATWRHELGVDIEAGGFGENFAITGMDESSVSIGDTYKVGGAVIQVSQPRRPCWKPARRYRIIDLALQIQNTGRTGWYFRVLQEGYVQPGDTLELIEQPSPEWTINACNEVMYDQVDNVGLAESLSACEHLAPNWRKTLQKRLLGKEGSSTKRVFGPNK